MADSHHRDGPHLKEKKRTRVQLSCTACRSRKLKCCRTHPCTNCKKRGEESSCTFVGRGPRGRTSQAGVTASPSLVQDRLQHLENLVLSFSQQKRQDEGRGLDLPKLDVMQLESPPSEGPPVHETSSSTVFDKESPLDSSSKLLVKDAGTSYIEGAHWTAILEEINGVKEYLREQDEESDEDLGEEESFDPTFPTLFFGLHKPASKEELLTDIPPRPVTDRLIAQFLNSREPFMIIFHAHSFQKEYNEFWQKPEDISLPWLGLLYVVLTVVIGIHQKMGEPLPAALGDPMVAVSAFRKRSAQCLAQSNYTQPGRYKVEALFAYTMGEFFRSTDAQVGVSFLLGTTARLAMRMGYHRDSQHFPSISVFEGEMRRRLWAVLCQLDVLISFQIGLPRTIQDWQHDVELPRNLADEDLFEEMEYLPPPRPDSEHTKSSYTIVKSSLMTVFGKISDLAYSREPVTYEEVMEIDRRLEEAHDLAPPIFKMRSIEQSIADPADLIFRRYTLDLIYQKARCVLHRRYLGEVDSKLRYAYSRWVCMSASKEILRQQAVLYTESQPGGILYRDRQFPNSLQVADYLLGAMILCLELSQNHVGGQAGDLNDDVAVVIKGQEDILAALETSQQIFEKSRRKSVDSQKAYNALTIMLRRVKKGLTRRQDPKRPDDTGIELIPEPIAQPAYGWPDLNNQPYTLDMGTGDMGTDMSDPFGVGQLTSLDVIEEMLDAPSNLDWSLWDQQIQGLEDRSANGACFNIGEQDIQ